MCVRDAILLDAEQIAQIVFGKMAFGVLVIVDHCVRKSFLVGLALENLLLNRSRLRGTNENGYSLLFENILKKSQRIFSPPTFDK